MFFNPNFTSLTNGDYPSNKPTNSLCISNSTGVCHETSFIFDSREEPPDSIPGTPTLLGNRYRPAQTQTPTVAMLKLLSLRAQWA